MIACAKPGEEMPGVTARHIVGQFLTFRKRLTNTGLGITASSSILGCAVMKRKQKKSRLAAALFKV
jgi:hypothetical protein